VVCGDALPPCDGALRSRRGVTLLRGRTGVRRGVGAAGAAGVLRLARQAAAVSGWPALAVGGEECALAAPHDCMEGGSLGLLGAAVGGRRGQRDAGGTGC
jgi:hypothetical protein